MLIQADARSLPLVDGCVDCVVTSPPYFGLRDYGISNQIGLERTPAAYVETLVQVFRDVRRVLKDAGTAWLNLGDSYARSGGWASNDGLDRLGRGMSGRAKTNMTGSGNQKLADGCKSKDLIGIPWRVAFALQADGWYLRSDIIWHKPNPMPESVTDRPTKAHEYLFLLTKNERYYYDAEAVAEPIAESQVGRVREDVIGGTSWQGRQQHSQGGVYRSGDDQRVPSPVAQLTEASILSLLSDRILQYDGHLQFGSSLQTPEGGFIQPGSDKSSNGSEFGSGLDVVRGGQFDHEVDVSAESRQAGFGHKDKLQSVVSGVKRNRRSVWTIPTMPYAGAHFATMPEKLVEPCILAGCPMGGLVLDPFSGSGTVLAVAERLGRRGVGTDLNPAYHELAKVRTSQRGLRWV